MKKSSSQIILLVVSVIFPMFALAQTTSGVNKIVHNLHFGMRSSEVALLQQKLQTLGYFPQTIPSSSYFGSVTKKAVTAFQKSEGIATTGFVGPLTRNAVEAKSAIVESHQSGTGGLANYPNEPLSSIPTTSISVKFLVEHRTALNGKTVTVQGFVVYALLGSAACPGGGIGACGQPRIFLADAADQGRNKDYDVMVLLREEDTGYSIGQSIAVTGVVVSSKVTAYITKNH